MNRRNFLVAAAASAAISPSFSYGQTDRVRPQRHPKLGASNAGLIDVREIKPAAIESFEQRFRTISEGTKSFALCPSSFRSPAVSSLKPLKTQFILLQSYTDENNKIVIKTPYGQAPEITGSDDRPDVAMTKLTLDAFHLDQRAKIKEKTRGLLRVTTANKPKPDNDVLSWAFTTAIDLYNQSRLPEREKSKVQQDLSGSVKAQPIQFLNGLGALHIEIIKEQEPSWWQELIHFFTTNPAVGALAASFGFPALGQSALKFVDELVTRIDDEDAEVLVSSDQMALAFTTQGRDRHLKGGGRRIGVMNQGTWIMIKPSDQDVLKAHLPYFADTYGRLVPSKYELPEDFLAEIENDPQKDPFYGVTYAVFGAELTPHKFLQS